MYRSKRRFDNFKFEEPSEQYHVENSVVTEELKILKMFLMSRNIENQVHAINKILRIITSKSKKSCLTGQMLICADIPGLLCDVMNNHDPHLIKKVFVCLIELSKDEEFYRKKHSTVSVETTCRTIRILASDEKNKPIIHKGIELLVQILSLCERELTINTSQILAVVSDIMKRNVFQGIHLAAMSLLKFYLRVKDLNHKELPELVYLALSLLHELWNNNAPRFIKHVKLALDIMTYSIRYFSSHPDTPLSEKAIKKTGNLVKTFLIPSLKDLDVNTCSDNIALKMMDCLLAVYDCMDQKRLQFLSNHLAAEGYLTLLIDLDHHYKSKTVHKYVVSLLYQIVARIARSELKISKTTCCLIGKGLKCLPADSSKWPQLLASPKHEHVHLALIMYLYISLLCDCRDGFTHASSLLPALSHYLLSQHPPPPSVILKAVSFVFAVLSVSGSEAAQGTNKELRLATHKLVSWLRCSVLEKVFTPHPAMLYWFFSDYVNDNILQMNAMALWLKDKSPASLKQCEDLVMKMNEAALCLLDVLHVCSEDLLPEVMSIFNTLLARDKSENRLNTSVHIWCNLPSTLSSLSTPGWEKRLNNTSCVISLACKVIPQCPNAILMLRLTQQLIGIIQNIAGKTWEETLINTKSYDVQLLLSQLFKLTNTIICKMILAKDYRGLKMVLEENGLCRALLASLDADNETVVHPAVILLTYLLKTQRQYSIQMKNQGTLIGPEFLQKLMSTNKANTAFFAANLFSSLQVLERKHFITLSNDMCVMTIYTLHLAFLNFSVREGRADLSWMCQSKLFQYCQRYNPDMELQLLNHPMNHLALGYAFAQFGIKDKHLAEFLRTYVDGVKRHKLVSRRSYARAICRDIVSTVLYMTAEQLLTKDWPTESLQSQLISQIATIGGNIPAETVNALKLKIPRRAKKLKVKQSDTFWFE